MTTDPGRLHVITDTTVQSRFDAVELAALAAAGGADVVQFREKRPGARLRRTVERLCEALAGTGTRLVVNDRPDLAAAFGAGVHVGVDDPDAFAARIQVGAEALVGRTIHDREAAEAWARAPVDYFGVGPFATSAHATGERSALGREGLADLVRLLPRPVLAVGGVDDSNAPEAIEAGAYGVAVLGAVVLARDPAEATARLKAVLPHRAEIRETVQ